MQHDQHQNEALPKIVFLNQSAVLIASKKNREKYRDHQVRLIDLMNKGVTILICPDCMKQYGVNAADLIDGVQVGKPSQTHESLGRPCCAPRPGHIEGQATMALATASSNKAKGTPD